MNVSRFRISIRIRQSFLYTEDEAASLTEVRLNDFDAGRDGEKTTLCPSIEYEENPKDDTF
jgi:hypothetical protein